MNKLKEYKKAWVSQTLMTIQATYSEEVQKKALENLFDAAIALDLPVKFAEWKDNKDSWGNEYYLVVKEHPLWTNKELYKYWIDNIYSPD